MSQLFGRISKLSSALNRRSFSTTPYLYLGREVVGESPCGGNVVNFNLYDPRKEEQAVIENQTLSKHLCESSRIGSSRGWLAMMNKRDSTVRLTNILNNNPSKTISLPRLIKDETERLIYVSVSSNDHGCVAVASARSDGSRLSMCRLGDSEWTLSTCLAVQDRKFYVNSCSSDYTGPTNFTAKYGPVNAYVRYPLSNSPKLDLRRLNIHQLFVQSPSGESFIVSGLHDGQRRSCGVKRQNVQPALATLWFIGKTPSKGLVHTAKTLVISAFSWERTNRFVSRLATILDSNLTLYTLLVAARVTASVISHLAPSAIYLIRVYVILSFGFLPKSRGIFGFISREWY
ncbi:hypothetical protein YC2023_062845 [Brassica napus]